MTNQRIQGTSRRDEEKHLEKTLAVIRSNMEEYGRQVSDMQADIDEMLEHYHDNDVEVYTILSNTITMHDHMKRALLRNEKALDKPYFGRIDFHDHATDQEESLYIGRGGISRDTTHQEVVDWRAPVANAYYENGLGECSYSAPDGTPLEIDLKLKRTYEIAKGELLDYFDSEVISNDELLTKYLARNKQAVLGEIVATIQKEQNEIIRRSPYHNIIVQGVAGSGKTTVAMHRISFILYNYAERFRPEDFYIVGSNRILLNYITGVLPDLDVYGVRQMTMEQLFVRLLYEDWDEKKYRVKKGDQSSDRGKQKGSAAWFEDLKAFCDRLERESISTESIYLNPRQFVEGIQDGKNGVYDRSTGNEPLIMLVDGEAVERYITQNPAVSIQSKINMLNDRLTKKIQEEFLGKGIKYTEEERKAILRAYRGRYGGKVWKHSTYKLYREFLLQQLQKGFEIDLPDQEFDVYDLAALAYIYKRTKETEVISEAHHIVIDEAQDFGMMIYHCLHACIHGCTYTVMGDVSQNIHFGFGLNDWESLKALLLSDSMDHFDTLKKSYRNTIEISNFATAILRHGRFFNYPVEPIIRHGKEVCVNQIPAQALYQKAAEVCKDWQERGLATIALVCRSISQAEVSAKALSPLLPILETDLEKAEFGNGVMVLPVEYTKGLEFDAVLILDPTREEYPVDDGHAKLLYVAATRALHELCILHTGNLTGLIADPVPEDVNVMPGGKNHDPAPFSNYNNASTASEHAAPADDKDPLDQSIHAEDPLNSEAKRPKAKVVIKPTVSQETPTYAKPMTSYAAKQEKAIGINQRKSIFESNGTSDTPKVPEGGNRQSAAIPAFGDQVPSQMLQPPGHTKIDLAVRWVSKDGNGLHLQSRYGLLRVKPIASGIIRVTFSRSGRLKDITHPLIAVDRLERFWTYKDTGASVELTTDELVIRVNKSTGNLYYFNRDKKALLSERDRESRLIEDAVQGIPRNRLFLNLDKKEMIYATDGPEKTPLPLRGCSRYITPDNISPADSEKCLPFLFSDRGYGLLIPTDGSVFFSDESFYGPQLCTDGQEQMDMYFIAGKDIGTLENACRYLYGRL
ncbi:MAG: DUF4968 domain-containing protein [Acetatifactor sp.]|nr:DUF4968 domain-containing protein [Acetatifactor sp.]